MHITAFAYSQEQPWRNLPKNRHIEGEISPVKISLTLDTLQYYRLSSTYPDLDPGRFWNADSSLKVGVGYLDEEGHPFSIWRYYTLKNNEFHLFCEGYYLKADSSNIELSEEGPLREEKYKQVYVDAVKSKLMHTGEWRFYQNDRLIRRLFLANKTKLRVESVLIMDDLENIISEQYVFGDKWRLIGNIRLEEEYYANGKLKSIVEATGYQLNITEDGKPVFQPMDEILPFWDSTD